jgi:hypothetical protein
MTARRERRWSLPECSRSAGWARGSNACSVYPNLAAGGCRIANVERPPALKITLDSTEPLDDAIRVVGAMYGVTLLVSDGEQDVIKLVEKEASRPSRKRAKAQKRPSAVRNARSRPAAAAASAGRSRTDRAPRPDGSPSNADVRSWARDNGLTVSDRGRMPASVMAAYLSAHNA